MRHSSSELAQRRKRLRTGQGGRSDRADALLHLLTQLQNRSEAIHELRSEAGQSLACLCHDGFVMSARQSGQWLRWEQISFEVVKRRLAELSAVAKRRVKRIVAAQRP